MHVSSRCGATVALAVSSLLLVSACNGGTDGPGASGAKASGSPAAPPEHISSAQAEQALVTGDALAKGWQREPDTILDTTEAGSEKDLLKGVREGCGPLAEVVNTGRPGADHKATAQAVFYKKGEETNLGQDVSGYTRAEATKLMDDLRKAVKDCASFDGTMDGEKATVKVTVLDVPKLGDESLGYAVRITYGDLLMDFDMATVRSVGGITTFRNNYSTTGDRAKAAFDKGLARAAEKLQAVTSTTK
ncbi:hypothetical protein [Streptomyces sp. NPDC059176]|uniref:hypothetical protein n=1 Tax=unclassified Streptomyces TaxID=2593676 RepID=UPI00367C53BB